MFYELDLHLEHVRLGNIECIGLDNAVIMNEYAHKFVQLSHPRCEGRLV